MSYTNVNENSIAASALSDGRDSKLDLVEEFLRTHGPQTGADILHIITTLDERITASNIWTRLGDAQRTRGSIRKTGVSKPSTISGRVGEVYEYVPSVGTQRLEAKLAYWKEAKERHEQEIKKATGIVARDHEMVTHYSAALAQPTL